MKLLETAVRVIRREENLAMWIDACCLLPRGEPSGKQAVDEMGGVYAGVAKVVVVLSKESEAILKMAKKIIKGQASINDRPALERSKRISGLQGF